MSADGVWYLDSSAIVKLVAREAETESLVDFVSTRNALVCSALATTEVTRVVLGLGNRFVRRAGDVLARIALIRVTEEVLRDASVLQPASLRSLDAIHLATASVFGDTLHGLVTYDQRMAEASQQFGWSVYRPA